MILLLSNNSNNSVETNNSLLSNVNAAQENGAISLLSQQNGDSGFDAFGGKDIFGSIDFSNMDNNLFTASAEGAETTGSVAYNPAETTGSIACASGAETTGSVACGSSDSGSSCSSFSSVC